MSTQKFDWKQHLSLIIAAISSIVISARLLAISNLSFETAYAVLQSVSTSTIIVGAVIPALGTIAVAAYSFICAMYSTNKLTQEHYTQTVIAIVVSLAICFYVIAEATFVIIIIVVPLQYWVMIKLSRRSIRNKRRFIDKIKREGRRPGVELERPVFPRPSLSVVVINTISLAVFAIFTSPPWLPATIVQVKNSSSITGFILTQNTFNTTILVNEPREVIYISTQNISTIELCSLSAESGYKIFNQTFPMLFKRIHGPNYPTCPGDSRIKNGQPVENR